MFHRGLFGAIAVSAFLFSASAEAADLKIVSWNLGNLASGPGVALRGHERSEAEYQHIREIVSKLAPDIIALQEMGSMASAKSILGDEYIITFEQRCLDNAKACREDVGDIFTAIAYNKSLGDMTVVQVPQLAVLHHSECESEPARPVRGGVGLEMTKDGQKTVILSVHLKASCKNNDNEKSADQKDDCVTLSKQVGVLTAWISQERQAGKQVIVAGDFNRQLIDNNDHVAAKLKSIDPNIKFGPRVRECWAAFQNPSSEIVTAAKLKYPEIAAEGGNPLAYSPRSNAKIDYFVISGAAADDAVSAQQYPMGPEAKTTKMATDYVKTCSGKPKKFEDGSVLTFSEVEPSDHCPISMVLK